MESAGFRKKRTRDEQIVPARGESGRPWKRAKPNSGRLFSSGLPPEMLQQIFGYFNFVQLGGVARVCRRWRDASYDALACRELDLSVVPKAKRAPYDNDAVLYGLVSRWNRLKVLRISKATSLTLSGIAALLSIVGGTLEELSLPAVEIDFSVLTNAATARAAFLSLKRLRCLELRGSLVTESVLGAIAETCSRTIQKMVLSGSDWVRADMRHVSSFTELQELSVNRSSDDLFDPSVLLPLTNLRSLSLLHALGDLPLAYDTTSRHSEMQLMHSLQLALVQLGDKLDHLTISDNLEFEHSWAETFNKMSALRSLSLRSFWYDASFWATLRVIGSLSSATPVADSNIQRLRLEFEYVKDMLDFVQKYMPQQGPTPGNADLAAIAGLSAVPIPAPSPGKPLVEVVYVAGVDGEEDMNDMDTNEPELVPVSGAEVIALASAAGLSPAQLLRELIRRNAATFVATSVPDVVEQPIAVIG